MLLNVGKLEFPNYQITELKLYTVFQSNRLVLISWKNH